MLEAKCKAYAKEISSDKCILKYFLLTSSLNYRSLIKISDEKYKKDQYNNIATQLFNANINIKSDYNSNSEKQELFDEIFNQTREDPKSTLYFYECLSELNDTNGNLKIAVNLIKKLS